MKSFPQVLRKIRQITELAGERIMEGCRKKTG
jgi:hypothetical protein